MTSEKNGRQIMKAFLNNQGASNDIRPNFYATFDEGETVHEFIITFQSGISYLEEFRGQFYSGSSAGSAVIEYRWKTNTVKIDVRIFTQPIYCSRFLTQEAELMRTSCESRNRTGYGSPSPNRILAFT